MNLAATTTSTTWNAVKRHHLMALAGASLAFAAIVGGGSILTSTSTESDASQPPIPSSSFRAAPAVAPAAPAMTYYIVGSEDQRAVVEAEAQSQVEDNAVYSPNKHWKFAVLVAGNMEQEAAVFRTIDQVKIAWLSVGASGLEIIDLRVSIPLTAYPPMTYFLVDSVEQHDLVVAQETDIASRQSNPQDHWFGVLVAGTPELEGEAWDMLESIQAQMSRCCPTSIFQVTDLRTE